MIAPDPVLDAIVANAVAITGAAAGRLMVHDGDDLIVVATAGLDELPIGSRVPATEGSAGYVVASGQPLAMAGQGDAVLCVPCPVDAAVVGALELVDKTGGIPFTFDDVELATVLAAVAGPALAHRDQPAVEVPDPEALGIALGHLAAADSVRYAQVASIVSALIQ